MSKNNLVIEADHGEKYELRPCNAPDPRYHLKPLYPVELNIEFDACLSNYSGAWSTHKLYIRRDDSWYEVWHWAFHTTPSRLGCTSHAWGWKHVTAA